MKKLFTPFAIVAGMMLCTAANANAQVLVNGYSYQITSENTVAVAKGGTDYTGEVTIPSTVNIEDKSYTVTEVLQNAFSGISPCTATKIVLPNTVTKLAKWSFSASPQLKTVVLSDNIKDIPQECFQSCETLSEIHLPANLESFGMNVFNKCTSLKEITFPASLKTFGTWCFQNTGLTKVELPEGITTVSEGLFAYNYNLENVVLPSTVTTVGKYAFALDRKITSFTVKSVTPPVADANTFDVAPVAQMMVDLKNATLYVPEESIEAYKTADVWKGFGKILAISSGVNDLVAGDFGIEICGLAISLRGYEGDYQVYAVDGRLIYSGSESTAVLPAKGIYIVKAGKKSLKVAL